LTTDLDPLLKRLHLANTRRVWPDLVQRAEKEDWSYDQFLRTLVAEEVAHRRGTRLTRALRVAAFPFLRTVEEFDFSYQSTLKLTTIGSLLAPDFVTEGRSVIFEGKPGRGKTHLAVAIAYRALQNGFDARFMSAAELIDDLSAASREQRLRDALAVYMRPHVLVVDEVGYLTYGNDAANVLYHIVNERQIRKRAMIFTTNKHPNRWGAVLHDDDLAEAIVDRILERGRLLRLDGPSLRTKHLPPGELADDLRDSRISGIQAAEFPEPTGFGAQLLADGLEKRATSCLESTIRVRDALVEVRWRVAIAIAECNASERDDSDAWVARSPPLDSFRSAVSGTPGLVLISVSERDRSGCRRARWRRGRRRVVALGRSWRPSCRGVSRPRGSKGRAGRFSLRAEVPSRLGLGPIGLVEGQPW
jgi:DNA replication protein DnaC